MEASNEGWPEQTDLKPTHIKIEQVEEVLEKVLLEVDVFESRNTGQLVIAVEGLLAEWWANSLYPSTVEYDTLIKGTALMLSALIADKKELFEDETHKGEN